MAQGLWGSWNWGSVLSCCKSWGRSFFIDFLDKNKAQVQRCYIWELLIVKFRSCLNQSPAAKMLRASLKLQNSCKRGWLVLHKFLCPPWTGGHHFPQQVSAWINQLIYTGCPRATIPGFGLLFFILANIGNTDLGTCWICYLLILELICSHKTRAFSIFGGPSWALSSGDAEYSPEKNVFGEILVFCYPKPAVRYGQIKVVCSGWVGGGKSRNGERI